MIYGIILLIFVSVIAVGFTVDKKQPRSTAQSPLLELSSVLSNNDLSVAEEVLLYLEGGESYLKKYKDELVQRGIEESPEVTDPIVLIDALSRANKLVYQDGSSEPAWTLEKLDELSNGRLKSGDCYQELREFYETTQYGIGTFLDQEGAWPSIFECAGSVGLSLMGINEDSDAYALVLVESTSRKGVSELAKAANIELYFENS